MGLIASSAFPIAVAIGLFFHIPRRLLASIVAFGADVLVVTLTSELMSAAIEGGYVIWAVAGLVVGCMIYIILDQSRWADSLLDRRQIARKKFVLRILQETSFRERPMSFAIPQPLKVEHDHLHEETRTPRRRCSTRRAILVGRHLKREAQAKSRTAAAVSI